MARPHCLRWLEHFMRAAASRTFWTAGNNSPMRMAMMAMTTNNSISVNPLRRQGGREDTVSLLGREEWTGVGAATCGDDVNPTPRAGGGQTRGHHNPV